MATQTPTIFSRLRSMETDNGQSLSALIDEACDVGEALNAALLLWLAYDDQDEADFAQAGPMLLYARAIDATRAALARATNGTQRREER